MLKKIHALDGVDQGSLPTTGLRRGGVTMPKASKPTLNKSAVSGRFVSNRQVSRSPKTTYKQTVKKRK